MKTKLLPMSVQELNRLSIVERIASKQLSQVDGARQLGVTIRQMRRLQRKYQKLGAEGLMSVKRGAQSNNQLDEDLKTQVLELIKTHYPDFGPKLAHEKLAEQHELSLSKESVRLLMIKAELWHGKKRKKVVVHQTRERRSCVGDLVQIDGSPHAWFEDRNEKCCLLVIIDDASSKLLALRFEPVESTQGYFRLFAPYLKQFGRPLACYHDKHGIFQINIKEPKGGEGITQFERAMKELGIKSISAHSPQAKGRVERVNRTLQDRLVKELRLKNISDMETGNNFLPSFIEDFNRRFAVVPRSSEDAHQKEMPDDTTLALIFSEQHTRILSKNLQISYENTLYQIKTKTQGYAMRGASITVCVDNAEKIILLYKGKVVPYTIHKKSDKITSIVDAKEINHVVDSIKADGRAKGHKPAAAHPWKRYTK